MAGMIGNNPEDMGDLANKLAHAVEQINQITSTLSSKASSVQWEGPDAKRFKGTEWPQYKSALTKVASELGQVKTNVLKQKAQQEQASA